MHCTEAVLSEVSGCSVCVAAMQYDDTAAQYAAYRKQVFLRTALEHMKKCTMQTVVEAPHLLKNSVGPKQQVVQHLTVYTADIYLHENCTIPSRPHCNLVA